MALTLRAVPRCRNSIITIMALERTISKVMGKRHTAVWAFKSVATIRTEDKIGKPSAIEKEQTLFFIFDIFLKCYLYFFRDDTTFLPHIHNLNLWKRSSFNPLRE